MSDQSFGDRLQTLIDQEEISRNTLSVATQIPYNTLKHSLETPGAILSVDHLLRLGEAYPHWNMTYLLTGTGPVFRDVNTPPEKASPALGDHWRAERQRVEKATHRMRGEAWGPFVEELQTLVFALLKENEEGWKWLNNQDRL